MKSFLKSSLSACLLTLTAAVFLSSCMPNASNNDQNSQLVIGVRLNDLDSTLTAKNDTLIINRVRFIHGKSFFTINPDSTIPLTGVVHQLTFSGGTSNTTKLIYPYPPRGPRPIPEGAYQGLTFKIIRANSVSDEASYFNPDPIFTDEGNYSIIVNGKFNNKEFTFKVSKAFDYAFDDTPFPVSVGQTAKLYQFLISADLEDWFEADTGDAFLDPTDDANKSAIYNNIETSFKIEQLSPEF